VSGSCSAGLLRCMPQLGGEVPAASQDRPGREQKRMCAWQRLAGGALGGGVAEAGLVAARAGRREEEAKGGRGQGAAAVRGLVACGDWG
jgi:hypothetical protein